MDTQFAAQKELAPTVEIIMGRSKRITGWGWKCDCGDGMTPRLIKKDRVLEMARTHFDTKHMGAH